MLYIHGGHGSGSSYRLREYPLIWIDADAFDWNVEQAARMERFGDASLPFWERAYELAQRGTFLVDELYSDWAEERRKELEAHLRQCVHQLAHLYRKQGDKTLAALRLRTYWQAYPTDEDALGPLMELQGEQELYQEAEACYQQLLTALQREGKKPDLRTQDVAEYLRVKQIQREHTATKPILVQSSSH